MTNVKEAKTTEQTSQQAPTPEPTNSPEATEAPQLMMRGGALENLTRGRPRKMFCNQRNASPARRLDRSRQPTPVTFAMPVPPTARAATISAAPIARRGENAHTTWRIRPTIAGRAAAAAGA